MAESMLESAKKALLEAHNAAAARQRRIGAKEPPDFGEIITETFASFVAMIGDVEIVLLELADHIDKLEESTGRGSAQ